MTVATIDTSAAERRALRIGLRLDSIADNYEAVVPMIREALELGDHETLGYRSPGDYLADRYGKALGRLPIAVRRETVAAIDSVQTLSTRSLAPVFDVTQRTISNDRQAIGSGEKHFSPASAPSAASPAEPEIDLANVDMATGEIHDGPVLTDEPGRVTKLTGANSVSHPGPVTGLDGKTYKRPEPREQKPRRKPLPEQVQAKADRVMSDALDIKAAIEDDRFASNRDSIAELAFNRLRTTALAITDFLAELDPSVAVDTEEARDRLVADLNHISETFHRLAQSL